MRQRDHVCMWEAQHCGLEIAEYALRALSSWGMCLVRAILLFIDFGGVRVCACTYLFQSSSIDSVGDGTYCECEYHSVHVWPIFQPFPCFECFVGWHSSNLNWFNSCCWSDSHFSTVGCLHFPLALSLSLYFSLFTFICPTLPLSTCLSPSFSSLWQYQFFSFLPHTQFQFSF